MSEQNKVYCNGVFIREKKFESTGNTILNVSIKADEMIAFLNQHRKPDGFVKIGISARRQPSDKGLTHTAWLDTWEPQQKRDGGASTARQSAPAEQTQTNAADDSAMPF